MKKINDVFLVNSSNILADTNIGLTTAEILKYFVIKGVEYSINIPYTRLPIEPPKVKRDIFYENLSKFNSEQQFAILSELVELPKLSAQENVIKVKQQLYRDYSELSKKTTAVDSAIVKETQHWLSKFPDALKTYNSGIEKYSKQIYERNLLDDMRLALELLLKSILSNDKSLENQLPEIGKFQKDKGLSTEFTNMFNKLLDYYSKYHNNYIKHNDKVNSNEVDFIVELTTLFMRNMIK